MSYSFSVKAKTKSDALAQVRVELEKVVDGQPTHIADYEKALAAVDAFLGVVADPTEDQVIQTTVHGSLSWTEPGKFTSASVGVSVSLVNG